MKYFVLKKSVRRSLMLVLLLCGQGKAALESCEGVFQSPVAAAPVALSYELLGTHHSGPTVVFLHGMGGSRESWRPFAERVSEFHRALILDLRGHGRSPDMGEDYSAATLAGDVRALIRKLGLGDVIMVGNSMGARVVAQYVLDYGPSVRGVLLEDMDLIRRTSSDPKIQHRRLLMAREIRSRTEGKTFTDREEAKRALETLAPTDWSYYVDALIQASSGRFHFENFHPGALALYWNQGNQTDLTRAFQGWTRPFYYVMADREKNWSAVTAAGERAIRRIVPSGTFITIPEADHRVHSGHPQEFEAVLNSFLAAATSQMPASDKVLP